MDEPRDTTRTWWRVAGSGLVVAAIIALSLGAWSAPGTVGTHAAIFDDVVVDLVLGGPRGVNGFVGHEHMAPGDRTNGTLILTAKTSGTLGKTASDLDFDLRLDGTKPEHARLLVVTVLRYGNDDLLTSRDGGRNLVAEIDANPLTGNRDGKLTLDELRAGANDLPPPGEQGTRFELEVEFDRNWTQQRIPLASFTLVFALSDTFHGDLN